MENYETENHVPLASPELPNFSFDMAKAITVMQKLGWRHGGSTLRFLWRMIKPYIDRTYIERLLALNLLFDYKDQSTWDRGINSHRISNHWFLSASLVPKDSDWLPQHAMRLPCFWLVNKRLVKSARNKWLGNVNTAEQLASVKSLKADISSVSFSNRSDEELTLGKSAFKLFAVANLRYQLSW